MITPEQEEAIAGEHRATPPEPAAAWFVRTYGKAIASALVAACAYLAGAVDDGITANEWLGLVPFVAAGYGITYAAPSRRTG